MSFSGKSGSQGEKSTTHRKGVGGVLAGMIGMCLMLPHWPRVSKLQASMAPPRCSGKTILPGNFSLPLHVYPPSSTLAVCPQRLSWRTCIYLLLHLSSGFQLSMVNREPWLESGRTRESEVGELIWPTSYLWGLAWLAVSFHQLHEPVRRSSLPPGL